MASYTADAAREVIARVLVDQAAGAGDYIVYAKCQRGGAGSSYVMLPKTTGTAASGETAIGFVSISLPVSTGDVVTIWVDGLAGDTTTPDIITDWYEVDVLRPTTVDQTLTVDASGRVDVSKIEGTDATDALDARITAAGLATATALATAQTSLNTIAGYIDTEVAAILAAVDTEVAAIKAKTDNLPSDPADQSQVEAAITAATTGLATASKLLKYVQLLARKDAAIATDNATELTAINANGGSGEGAFANTTDSQEALRDRGDAAWTTGSSVLGSGSEAVRIRCLNGAAPVDGAAVWITTDSAGTNVVAGTVYTSGTGYTSTLMLDPGTYYVWRQANGVNFTNPETITVSDL